MRHTRQISQVQAHMVLQLMENRGHQWQAAKPHSSHDLTALRKYGSTGQKLARLFGSVMIANP